MTENLPSSLPSLIPQVPCAPALPVNHLRLLTQAPPVLSHLLAFAQALPPAWNAFSQPQLRSEYITKCLKELIRKLKQRVLFSQMKAILFSGILCVTTTREQGR